MTDTNRLFAPPDTPGYTGRYEVRNGVLYAMEPDGTWVPIRRYDDFKTKETR